MMASLITPMYDQFWTDVLGFAQRTSHGIGSVLLEQFGMLTAVQKPDGTLVTAADKWSDLQIREAIAARFPEHGVLTEETAHIFPEQDWCWIVDPIDGTTNFTRGIPIWGISLGLLYRGTPVFGYVYFPPIAQSYYGYWYGDSGLTGPTGAYRNGLAIQVSQDEPSLNHVFSLCTRSTKVTQNRFPCKIRLLGVSSYNALLVASGVTLGGVEATPKIWDIAAVWAILQAAGGVFVSLESKAIFPLEVGKNYGDRPFPCLIAGRADLVETFKPLVSFIGEEVCAKYGL